MGISSAMSFLNSSSKIAVLLTIFAAYFGTAGLHETPRALHIVKIVFCHNILLSAFNILHKFYDNFFVQGKGRVKEKTIDQDVLLNRYSNGSKNLNIHLPRTL